MKRCAVLLTALGLAGCSGGITKELRPEDVEDASASATFARMQTLAGKWKAEVKADVKAEVKAEPKAEPKADAKTNAKAEAPSAPAAAPAAAPTPTTPAETITVEYLVTEGGHALQEKLFAETDHESVTTYRLEGTDLTLLFEGMPGTRPHMKLDRKSSTRDDLHFVWDAHATDVEPTKQSHIHEGRIHFVDADNIECEWVLWVDGKEASRHRFTLRRTAGKYSR
jgi:hypothetical protein